MVALFYVVRLLCLYEYVHTRMYYNEMMIIYGMHFQDVYVYMCT